MIFSILKNILIKFYFFKFIKHNYYPYIFLSKKNYSKKIIKISFLLDDLRIFHFGDLLFFEPLICYLNNFFKIEIITKSKLSFYFKSCNYKVVSEYNPRTDLTISYLSNFMISKIKFTSNLIAIDPNYLLTQDNLTNQLINSFSFILKKKNIRNQSLSYIKNINSKFNYNFKYVLINNEIYSSMHMYILFKNKFNRIFQNNIIKLRKNYKIIKVGNGNNNYFSDIIDIDLSRKTSLKDIFFLVNNKNCIGTVSFDNFLMHLAFMYKKKFIYIIERGRISNKKKIQIRSTTIPFFDFKSQESKVIYIND